jgi:hypothetical protein
VSAAIEDKTNLFNSLQWPSKLNTSFINTTTVFIGKIHAFHNISHDIHINITYQTTDQDDGHIQ